MYPIPILSPFLFIPSLYASFFKFAGFLNEWRQVIKKSCYFKKEAYKDGIKRKGDKIGMGYIKHGDLSMLKPLTP